MLMLNFKANHVAKMIKKELSELKSFFQELGFSYEPCKDNYGNDDLKIKCPATLGLHMAKAERK